MTFEGLSQLKAFHVSMIYRCSEESEKKNEEKKKKHMICKETQCEFRKH